MSSERNLLANVDKPGPMQGEEVHCFRQEVGTARPLKWKHFHHRGKREDEGHPVAPRFLSLSSSFASFIFFFLTNTHKDTLTHTHTKTHSHTHNATDLHLSPVMV